MDNIEIYYFSGTGNSLHVARELQKRIPGIKLLPMVSLFDENVIQTSAETVGFVFPTYLATVPAPVRKFVEKLDLKSCRYLFSITTRIGFGVANVSIEKLLKKKEKRLDSSFDVNMANNSPTGLKPLGDKNWAKKITKEEIDKLESKVQKQLDSIKECIVNQERTVKKGLFAYTSIRNLLEHIMTSMTKNLKKEITFYADSYCTGCGICEKVCLSNKIRMMDNKPEWLKDIQCYFCYACFNFCPIQSILVGKLYRDKNGRYFHPEVSSTDIEEQKNKTTPCRI